MLRTLRTTVEIALAAYTAIMLVACSFKPGASLDTPADVYRILNMAPYTSPYDAGRWIVEDEAGRLRVEHGYSCVYASQAASEHYIGIRVQEHAIVPDHYDGTVFMNGWHAEYVDSDHHVIGLGSAIFNIQRQGSDLSWEAGGLISDDNGDDAYRWCYDYDVLLWPKNSSEFEMKAANTDSSGRLIFLDGPNQSGVVHSIAGSFRASGKKPRAALPNGFAMAWTDDDHHVLQLAFELGPQSVSGKTLSWNSSTILKDDSANRSYEAAEAVSVLRGRGFELSAPSTVLRKKQDGSWATQSNVMDLSPRAPHSCGNVQIGDTEHVYQFSITGLRSRYAIPVLTGWELAYSCSDQHVKRVGAWISDYNYVQPSGATTGTLYYTVHTDLADDDSIPGFLEGLEVSVLGVNLLRPVTMPGGPITNPIGANPGPSL